MMSRHATDPSWRALARLGRRALWFQPLRPQTTRRLPERAIMNQRAFAAKPPVRAGARMERELGRRRGTQRGPTAAQPSTLR